MKVRCIKNHIDDELASKVGLPPCGPRYYHSVSPGKEYVVLGLCFNPETKHHAGKPFIDVRNDSGGMTTAPIFLFEIIDDKVSIYWRLRFKRGVLTLYPKLFYDNEYFPEDLADGVPEIEANFRELCEKFEQESECVGEPY